MIKRRIVPLVTLAAVAALVISIGGCSKDDPVTPPTDNPFLIRLKAGQTFIYNRWDLKSDNTKDETTKRSYTTQFVSSNGRVQGAYTDWLYRFGTDSKTPGKQDTLQIRVEQTNSDVMIWGFQRRIYAELINRFATLVPGGVGNPTIPSEKWDIIASYTGTPGTTTWNISSPTGESFAFSTPFGPINVTVTITGKYEAKDEMIMVGTTNVKTRKTSVTTTVNVLNNNFNLKMYMWFSDSPAGQIKVVQESTSFTLLTLTLPIPGETQELSAIPM